MRSPLLFIFCCISISAWSQSSSDSVSTNAGNMAQVWYSLQEGTLKENQLSDWHLGFQINGFHSSILFNSADGNRLYAYPKADISGWENVDTTGLFGWKPLFNADTSWNFGAFNINTDPTDPFDLGWGKYNINNHQIVGDSLFIVVLVNGTAQKLMIEKLANGEYTFIYADIDGSNEHSAVLKKADFNDKNFGYYNLLEHKTVDLEPEVANWDLLFSKYTTKVSMGPGITLPYEVVGILLNAGRIAQKIYPVDQPESFNDYSTLPARSSINDIGYNWKKYDYANSRYNIEDSTVYLIQTGDQSIWKVIMTGYGGSATGKISFTKELLFSTSISQPEQTGAFLEAFPNPSTNGSVTISTYSHRSKSLLTLTTINGQTLQTVNLPQGLQTLTINTQNLEPGMYMVMVASESGHVMKKIIIQ